METDTLCGMRKTKSVRFQGLSPASSPDDKLMQGENIILIHRNVL